MLVPQLLLETLEDISSEDFKKFKWFLTLKISHWLPIPRARVENACRLEAVSKMIESYGEEMAVQIAEDILRKMQQNNAATRLRTAYSEGIKAVSSTTSNSVTTPSAPASISAQQNSVIIAPTLNNSNTGALNINIHKS